MDFYVAKAADGGNDANPGTSLGSPKLTIPAAGALMSAGDALFIRAGTYNTSLADCNIPSGGGSFATATTVKAYNGETAIIQSVTVPGYLGANRSYIILEDLIFDGTISPDDAAGVHNGSHHIRYLSCEIRNAPGNGLQVAPSSHHNEFISCSIHDNGLTDPGPPHALYISGSYNLFEHNHVYNQSVGRPTVSPADKAGGGFHVYDSQSGSLTGNIIRYNTVHDCPMFGILLSSGPDNQAYGNICYDSLGDGIAIYGGVAFRSKVFNNTCYGNVGMGIRISVSSPTALGCFVQNNICYNNTEGQIDTGADTTVTANHNFTSDPFFLSPGSGDFHLTLGSPAIDFGVIIDGRTYTGASPDAGALEFGGEDLPDVSVDPIPPLPPGGGGTIDYDSDGDTVDIPGVGEGLPPSGSVPLPPGQTLITVIAYNVNGSSIMQQTVRQFAGGMTYRAAAGYMPRSIKGGADLSVDNSELVGIMANKAIANQFGFLIKGVLTDEDIEVGRFDNARDELFLVNYEDLSMGKYFLPSSGGIGQIKSKRGLFEAETRGKQYFLQQTFGDLISKLCRARLGNDVGDGTGEHDYKKQRFGCKVRIDPPFWRAETAYTVRPENDAALGSVVKPQVYNGRHFECVTAGTSALYPVPQLEPDWNLPVGSTTTDGSVTWRAILALEVFGSVTGAINRRFFQDSARYEPPTTGIGINTGIAQYAIVAASISGNYFDVEGGDLTRIFLPSTTFTVTGSIANDATYTVTVSSLVDGRTRIVVSETIPDDRAGGSIGAPNALATGFFTHGLLTFLTGLNTGITMEIKEFHLSQYPLVDVDQGAFMFLLDGDVSDSFVVGQRFAVAGSTGNDTEYNIVAVTYNGGNDQTEITVDAAIADATVDGNILAGPGQFELFERMPFDIEVGDEYIASAGCDLAKAMCKFKFRNIYNRRAEDETPGTDVALLTPDRPQ